MRPSSSPASRLLPLLLAILIAGAVPGVRCSDRRFPHLDRVRELHRREGSSPAEQEAAARGLLQRILPSHSASFEFRIISTDQCGGKACFIISNHPLFDGEGTPEILGSMPSAISVTACKFYSFAWWDWERWEKEIDWMALQGINLPLAFTGQESIWQRVFQRYNISKSDLDDFFGGPAFLAWSRMANMHGWGGPLPQTWLDDQLALQKKILSRMYAFGMFPVLPAFSGNIPAALRSKFPSAKVTHLGNCHPLFYYCLRFTVDSNPRWCCTYLLDASDPLFVEIGKFFIEEQIRERKKNANLDTSCSFAQNMVGQVTYTTGSLTSITLQGWLFTYDPFWEPPQMKALLHSVPVGRMIVLDLYAEVKPVWISSDQFYGVPYIWKVLFFPPTSNTIYYCPFLYLHKKTCVIFFFRCMLHNFAADFEMYGVLDALAYGPIDARLSDNSTMVGVGMSMEGIEQNPIVYDLMSEMAFHHRQVDLQVWVQTYPTRRYGKPVKGLQDAWWILYQTLYNCSDGKNDKNRDVIVAFPDVEPLVIQTPGLCTSAKKMYSTIQSNNYEVKDASNDAYEHPHLWYDTSVVIHALELFLQYGDEVSDSNTFRYDLVDLTRQVLAKYANDIFSQIIKNYKSNGINQVATLCHHFLDLVNDLDVLLASHEGFLLGPWLENAKSLARDREQEIQYEWNARTQITMWFDNTKTKASLLRDYANKYWSGLLRDYYGPRAAIYFKHLLQSMEKNEPFALEEWRREWIRLTNNWQSDRKVFPTTATGDPLNISRSLYMKYVRGTSLLELQGTGSLGNSASLV
nr:unnamed protein product [Digitaria exilis]